MSPEHPGSRRSARIVPVVDVANGQVVRAVGGRRELYAPVCSKLTDSTDPPVVAAALLAAAGVNELYVADLDSVQGHRRHLGWVRELTNRGVVVLVDAGVRVAADAQAVCDVGAAVVAGTETVAGFGTLQELCQTLGPDRVILSLDLRNEKVTGSESAWGLDPDPLALVREAVDVGVRRIIALELARVGTGIGPGTTVLCRQLRQAFPDIELIAGGGVRDRTDVEQLAAAGADGVLVASALHAGTM